MKQRGFTVVELIITVTIMGILLILTVVNVSSSQMRARDDERSTDVQSIALNLESYFSAQQTDNLMSGGSYVGSDYLTDTTFVGGTLPDIDPKVLRAPGVDISAPQSFIAATNAVQTKSGVLPQPTKNTYVYQPLTTTNTLCTDPFIDGACRKFNIYYYLESDNQVYMITSKNQ